MKKLLLLLAMLLLLVPVVSQAQGKKKAPAPAPTAPAASAWEYGADAVLTYSSQSLNGQSDNAVVAVGPLDWRVGHTISDDATVELRGSFVYHSHGATNGDAFYIVNPGLNVTYALGGGTTSKGLYATVGAGLAVTHDVTTVTQTAANAGVGIRYSKARLEAFIANTFKKSADGLPNELNIGVRAGFSLRN